MIEGGPATVLTINEQCEMQVKVLMKSPLGVLRGELVINYLWMLILSRKLFVCSILLQRSYLCSLKLIFLKDLFKLEK